MMNEFNCQAVEVRQPSGTFYIAALAATEVETICRPLRQPSGSGLFSRNIEDPIPLSDTQLSSLVRSLESNAFAARSSEVLTEERTQPYQRFLDEKRAVEISKYLQQPSALLPNSIILAVSVDLDEDDVIQKSADKVVLISLPRDHSSAVILDGQHRVAAFRYLPEACRQQFQIAVTFLIGVSFYQQAEIFAIINGKQKPVNKSIIYDLFGYAPIDESKDGRLYDGLMAVSRFCSHVTRILNGVIESPWRNQIKMRGPGDSGAISQAAVVEYMSALVEPKTYTKRLKVLPLLYFYFKSANPAACASLLIVYLRAIQDALPDLWNDKKSLFWKTNGIAVILRLLHDEIMLAGSLEETMRRYSAISHRWKRAPRSNISNPPKSGGGGIQTVLYTEFFMAMFDPEERSKLESIKDNLKTKLMEIGAIIS